MKIIINIIYWEKVYVYYFAKIWVLLLQYEIYGRYSLPALLFSSNILMLSNPRVNSVTH